VTTLYGSFDENQLKSIRDALSEISNEMSVIDSHKEAIKDVIDALYDNFKIPKKVLRRMAKTHHKQSFQEEVTEDNEFEALYIGMTETK
jgi:DNA repair exonuclease SbcCD ATPase subunit